MDRDGVVRKASQVGVSERNIAVVMAHAIRGDTVYYVLPTIDRRNLFVANRVDRILASNELYRELAASASEERVNGKHPDAVSYKALGDGAVLFGGSNAKSAGLETPVDVLVIDEFDYCNPDVIPLLRDRVKHSDVRRVHITGNPTIAGFGIDEEFGLTDQRAWVVACPHCGERQSITWWDNVVERVSDAEFLLRMSGEHVDKKLMLERDVESFEGYVVCSKCLKPIDRYTQGEWVAKHPARTRAGWSLSQIFVGVTPIGDMINSFAKALGNQFLMQHFANNALGEPFESEGAKLSPALLHRNVRPYDRQHSGGAFVGIDVGKVLHAVVLDSDLRVIEVETLVGANPFDVANELMNRHSDAQCVIDIAPERFLAREFQANNGGRVILCDLSARDQTTEFKLVELDEPYSPVVCKIERTQFLDLSHAAMLRQEIALPSDAATIPDFFDHLCSPTRVLDTEGRVPRYVWVESGSVADHYRFALGFAYLASHIRRQVGEPSVSFMEIR